MTYGRTAEAQRRVSVHGPIHARPVTVRRRTNARRLAIVMPPIFEDGLPLACPRNSPAGRPHARTSAHPPTPANTPTPQPAVRNATPWTQSVTASPSPSPIAIAHRHRRRTRTASCRRGPSIKRWERCLRAALWMPGLFAGPGPALALRLALALVPSVVSPRLIKQWMRLSDVSASPDSAASSRSACTCTCACTCTATHITHRTHRTHARSTPPILSSVSWSKHRDCTMIHTCVSPSLHHPPATCFPLLCCAANSLPSFRVSRPAGPAAFALHGLLASTSAHYPAPVSAVAALLAPHMLTAHRSRILE